jgi:hypothetical protein
VLLLKAARQLKGTTINTLITSDTATNYFVELKGLRAVRVYSDGPAESVIGDLLLLSGRATVHPSNVKLERLMADVKTFDEYGRELTYEDGGRFLDAVQGAFRDAHIRAQELML